jgi:hypothetical protein
VIENSGATGTTGQNNVDIRSTATKVTLSRLHGRSTVSHDSEPEISDLTFTLDCGSLGPDHQINE